MVQLTLLNNQSLTINWNTNVRLKCKWEIEITWWRNIGRPFWSLGHSWKISGQKRGWRGRAEGLTRRWRGRRRGTTLRWKKEDPSWWWFQGRRTHRRNWRRRSDSDSVGRRWGKGLTSCQRRRSWRSCRNEDCCLSSERLAQAESGHCRTE